MKKLKKALAGITVAATLLVGAGFGLTEGNTIYKKDPGVVGFIIDVEQDNLVKVKYDPGVVG